MLPWAKYLNCDLPSVARQLENPEYLFRNLKPESMVIFDEIHRIEDPSLVLKIGTDEFPGIKILALTVHEDDSYLYQVMNAGADGYLTKKAADAELLAAIRATHRGEHYIHSSMTESLLARRT